jgi:hypothetical protein
VACATLRRHYGRWMPSEASSELDRFRVMAPGLFTAEIVPEKSPIVPDATLTLQNYECERGDLNPHG